MLWWVAVAAAVGGCVTSARIGRPPGAAVERPTPPGDASPPAPAILAGGQETRSAAEQAGLVNAAVQGITGISVQQAIPVGLVVLVMMMMWVDYLRSRLSHKRETLRIQQRDRPP